MQTSHGTLLAVAVLSSVFAFGCSQAPPASAPASSQAQAPRTDLFAPLPESIPGGVTASQALVDLGRMLYYDPRLSKSQQISCNSCHALDQYGVDSQPTSDGHKGQMGTRNSPTVYNAALHIAQFWDGRAPDVEAQAKGPVLNPVEMAMASEQVVVRVLQSMPEYVEAFGQAFPGEAQPMTYDNMAKAIGAFERRLMTPSRFDAFVKGDLTALTPDERTGFDLFVSAGCPACHAGALLGADSFQRLGAVKAYPRTDDAGRFDVTKSEADRFVFKVPSLRNIEKTGPYFHDGRVASLEDAIRQMGEYQLGKPLGDAEVRQIVVFLKTLTGRLPVDYIKPPTLPRSTEKTPKPDLS
jgi:cytochrome c peroxidase